MHKGILVAVICVGTVLAGGLLCSVYAQEEADLTFITPDTSVDEIVEKLASPPAKLQPKGARTKGLWKIEDDPAAQQPVRRVGANIEFAYDSDEIAAAWKPVLDKVAAAMQHVELRDCVILVAGHTDSIGSHAYNDDLSKRRAAAVKTYLQQFGIEDERLLVKGFGKRNPVATNDTAEGRAKNRRVEFERVQ
jgi:outer membrane protein OmpA-like peptidoglycan-associated protein